MTATTYSETTNAPVDSTRGNLLTDIQMHVEETPMPSSTKDMALNDITHHDIRSILERPVNLGTFEWKSTDEQLPMLMNLQTYEAGGFQPLKTFNFPQAIFEASPLVVDKLKNFQYMKADIEIEVKLNAQRFLQGSLLGVYNPYNQQVNKFRKIGTRYMASQTSCPHKIITIEQGDSLKMTCPYANIYDLFDLGNSNNQFGTFDLFVHNALVGNEAGVKCNYTVFARFINPRYYTPTQYNTLQQYSEKHMIKRLEKGGYRFAQSSVSPQAASDTGEVTTGGPVSTIAKGVSMVSDVLSDVPIIGDIASSVAWVSRVIGRTAASVGLSKPTPILPQEKRVIKPTMTLIHTEGTDDSTTLALIQDNGIDGSSSIPETKDEMSLKYILGRPNYFHAFTATDTTFTGTKKITAWEVSPLSQFQYGDTSDSQTLCFGSFAYTSMQGTVWRGTINYDVMIIKTPYHQGRFAAVFLPETNLADVPDELGDLLNTNQSVICDLMESRSELGRTTMRIKMPFISNTCWRKTYKRNKEGTGPDATTLETKTGCIALYSLVPLSFPPTVSNRVTFYIAHSGGDDYQIGMPTNQLIPGFQSYYAQSDVAYAQTDVGAVVVPPDEQLLFHNVKSEDVTAQTTGEYFTSLRSLIKRFNKFASLKPTETYTGLRTRLMTEDDTGQRTMSRTNFTDNVLPTSWYMVSFLFRFFNGSSMLKAIPKVPGATAEAFTKLDPDITHQTAVPEKESHCQPLFVQNQQMSNAFEIRTPYYQAIRCNVVGSNQTPVLGDVRTCFRVRNLAGYGSTTAEADLFEAAGDDFSFFYLVGPPPMCDIANLKDPISFPTGTSLNVTVPDTATLTTETVPFDKTLAVRGMTFGPNLPITESTYYANIATSTLSSVVITYLDTTTENVFVLDTRIAHHTGSTPTWYIPTDANKTVDTVTTLTALKALEPFTVVTDHKPT